MSQVSIELKREFLQQPNQIAAMNGSVVNVLFGATVSEIGKRELPIRVIISSILLCNTYKTRVQFFGSLIEFSFLCENKE
jgi:hypothetical protein